MSHLLMMMCLVCKQEFKFITQTHLKKHRLTPAMYKEMFPESEMQSKESRVIRGEKISASKKGKSSPMKGCLRTDCFKQKVKNNHWSKKPIEETQKLRLKLAENGKKAMDLINKDGRAHRWTSETAKALWTEEHRQEIKKQLTGLKRSEETKAKIRASHWARKSNNEVDEIIQRIFLKDAQFKNAERGWYFSTKSGHEMFYMSSYERRRLEYLESLLQVKWFSTMHGIHIPYEFQGSHHLYIPDIHVKWKDGSETLEEIKGYVREPEKHEAKIRVGQQYSLLHNMKFCLLFESELEK